ncbi:phage tail protein [Rhizobium herbae]|uniref:Phage tail protein n=1 Tax=Rhizobium herbae TaxID=508661 RepID=A0ABS7H549_9HYPH|nr:pyocin knob domain-containing protein [Rhizobium herbae]MBW9062366.1 phage tail protein [Rhizobium herbae]
MANDDLIRSGTASVTNGQVSVTGQSVSWANVREGDFFGAHVGLAIPIAAIAGSAITLAYPWPGPTQNTATYAIQPKGDVTRFQDRVRVLLETLTDGDLAAIAGLISAADKLPYFSGPGAAALADFKAKGRDIVAADTMTALLAKLGPVHGGVAPLPSNAGVGLIDGDFNTITYPGIYTIGGSWLNGPTSAAATTYTGILVVMRRVDADGYTQIMHSTASGSAWKRYTSTVNAASWPNAWQRIEHPVQGPVSQSGGIATGALIEKGNNGNGEYVKFADGTLICTIGQDLASQAITTARGSLFGSNSFLWTFPAAFAIFTPKITYDFERNDAGYVGGGSSLSKTLTSVNYVAWNSSSNPAGNAKLMNMAAVGRWF